ncbi:MAG: phosphodiesterase [Lachnospiraceae bacterium]|nr:phosphodiesterase [Lachnospiraceae bacterium]
MTSVLIASDIHGSAYYAEALMARIEAASPDRIVLLGDLLYHGPRNDLPRDYAPKAVIPMLNSLRSRLLCVRGNCDGEVDQMVLDFPIMADYAWLSLSGRDVLATHGHHFGEMTPPPLPEGGILLNGHTHVPAWTEHPGFLYLNPGSVAIPKAGSCHSYMMWENDTFTWRDVMTGEIYHTLTLG